MAGQNSCKRQHVGLHFLGGQELAGRLRVLQLVPTALLDDQQTPLLVQRFVPPGTGLQQLRLAPLHTRLDVVTILGGLRHPPAHPHADRLHGHPEQRCNVLAAERQAVEWGVICQEIGSRGL